MAPRLTNTSLRNFISTTQGKSYTVGAVTILLVLVIFMAGIFPALSSILFQIQQNGERTNALQEIETKRQTLRSLSTEEQSKHAISLSLDANLPDSLDQTGLFTIVNNMVNSVGCQLISVTFNDLESRRNFVAAFGAAQALDGKAMNITVTGNRAQMEAFVGAMENSRRVFNIVNLSMFNEDTSSSNSADSFRMDLQTEVYFWNQAKTQ
jgi:Tfp pilus assembly protein PilO